MMKLPIILLVALVVLASFIEGHKHHSKSKSKHKHKHRHHSHSHSHGSHSDSSESDSNDKDGGYYRPAPRPNYPSGPNTAPANWNGFECRGCRGATTHADCDESIEYCTGYAIVCESVISTNSYGREYITKRCADPRHCKSVGTPKCEPDGTCSVCCTGSLCNTGGRLFYQYNGRPNNGYGQNGYGQRNNGYGQHNNGYDQHNNGYGQHNNGYGRHNNGYGQHNNGYGRHNHGYGQRNNGYGQHHRNNKY